MDLGLKGKTAIVTGSARGIGRVIAHTFAEEGANVVFADILAEDAQKAAEETKSLGVGTLGIKVDISNAQMVDDMVKATVDKFGKVDILVNNATIIAPAIFFVDEKIEDVEREVKVIYLGTLNCMRSAFKYMTEQNSGAIVNILSDSARVGDMRMGNYAGCKAGIGGISRSISREVARYHIRVNCVSPSMTITEMAKARREDEKEQLGDEKFQDLQNKRLKVYPIGRLGEPQDIANMVVFLASERASWITGQTVSVNGGYAIGPW